MSNPTPNTAGRDNAPLCSRLRQRDKQPCRAKAIRGSEPPSCRKHMGRALSAVRAEVAVREEVLAWGLGNTKTDPGELLLRLVTQAAIRAETYGQELARVVNEHGGNLEKALTGDAWAVVGDGEPVKVGEYIRSITQLEADERVRAANFATKAIAAGLAERQVRLAEQQGQMLAAVIRSILGELDLTPQQQALVAEVVPRHLRAVSA